MGWKPIDTAPNAGEHKRVWVFGGRHEIPEIILSDGSFWRYQSGKIRSIPTHWMELEIPEPPK